MIDHIRIDKKRKFCVKPIGLLDVIFVGARLARESHCSVCLIACVAGFAGKPRSDR
jgi:hypothetical protein